MVLCWALWSVGYSNAQETAAQLDPGQTYITGNLVVPTTTTSGSTWTNGVYQDGLTCWGGGQPGYCGPNPIVRPDGNINYSYGWVDLYQQQLIAGVLPYSGTGLRVNGYNFNFMAKNGSGWDDGRTDLLYAYVQFDGPSGTILNNTANLSYQFNWSRITLDQTFAAPYAVTDITSVRYGFVGQDNNFWAGPYGPEIYDVNFSLRYSVDPCVSDPLYSPTCPGYLAALQALIPVSEPAAESLPVETTAAAAAIETAPITASTAGSEPTVQSEPARVSESVAESPGEKKAGASLSTILSIVRSEQDRVAGVESRVVEAANEQAQAAADRATEQALAVAETGSTASQMLAVDATNSVTTAASSQIGSQGSSVAAISVLPTQSGTNTGSSESQSQESSDAAQTALGSGLLIRPAAIADAAPAAIRSDLMSEMSTVRNAAVLTSLVVTEADVIEPQRYNVSATTAADDFLEPRTPVVSNASATAGTSVNRRTQDNDVAAGVSLDAMATQPRGYDQYNVALTDRPFYPDRPIYVGQRTVDNVRALRQLSSDRLHQEMVDQQYKK